MREKMKKTQCFKAHSKEIRLLSVLFIMLFLTSFASALELNPFATAKILDKEITLDTPEFLKADFNKDYGTIKLSKTLFWIQTDKIAEYSLTSNTERCYEDCSASGKAVLYSDGKLFDSFDVKDKKGNLINLKELKIYLNIKEEYIEKVLIGYDNICGNGTKLSESCYVPIYEEQKKIRIIKNEYDFEELKAGNYSWTIYGKKDKNQSLDWAFSKDAVSSDEIRKVWANWTTANCSGVGGTITIDGDYCVHTYLTSGNFSSSISIDNLEAFVVAGGGGGGTTYNWAAGGGAGGINHTNISYATVGNTTVTVGNGGTAGNNGANSSFGSVVIAVGGGRGATLSVSAGNGGSGGGRYVTDGTVGFGIVGQGNNGGVGFTSGSGHSSSGGGGGAGSSGGNATLNVGGIGGAGLNSSINGSLVCYAGGGGGGVESGSNGGTATCGGGAKLNNAIANTGGGGGAKANGGSGIVIIRYHIPEGVSSLDYVTPPTLVDYANISQEYIPIQINYTLKNSTLSNITYSLRNVNGTNFTLYFTNATKDINFTNIPDAHYHYDVTVCAVGDLTSTVYCSTTVERHINHDATAPQFTLNSLPDVSTIALPVNNTFNITTTDPALSICKYSTSENTTNITYTCNTSVTISFATGGVKAVTVYANDTYGNSNQTTYSFNLYDFVVVQSGDATGSEGTDQTFTLDVYSTSFPIGDANAVLYYNGTNQGIDTKTNFNSTLVQFSKTIALWNGSGNSTGYPQSWLWNYNTTYLTTRNTSTQTQNVYSVSITDCDLTSGRVILNLSLKDEELNSLVNVTSPNLATIEVDLYVSSLSNSSLQWHFYKKWSNNNTATICVPNNLLNSSSYKIEFTVGYDATDHVREFYYLENGTLDNTNYFNSYTDNTIDLMDLLTADSTTFLFSYTDSAKQEVDDIVVHTFRKYIGEGLFREVERSKQDNNGQTHVHLVEEDVIYYFMITQYGNILYTSNTYNAKCLSTPCSIELSASQTSFNWSIIDNEGGKYSTTANKTTRVATTTFALDTISLVNVSLYKFNGTSVLINSSSLTSGSGSIPLTVPLSYGNATFYVVIYKNNTFVKSSWVDLTDRGQDYFGTAGAILGGLIVLALLLMAVSEGVGAIIFTCLALVVITIMKLIDLNWFALISLICAGGIIVWKLVRRQGVKG